MPDPRPNETHALRAAVPETTAWMIADSGDAQRADGWGGNSPRAEVVAPYCAPPVATSATPDESNRDQSQRTQRTVAALFVRADSVYRTLPGVDCYDEKRNARTFRGGMPVVAHPPCKRWSSLNNLVLVRYPHKAAEFAHGNDGGLFALALDAVRTWGGVLEHPAQSRAWRKFDLPAPAHGRWQQGVCGGWCIELDQASFGHPARKRTWLYAFGATPPTPPTPPTFSGKVVRVYRRRNDDGTWSRQPISETNREISKKAAEQTPRPFAEWLVALARHCSVAERKTA